MKLLKEFMLFAVLFLLTAFPVFAASLYVTWMPTCKKDSTRLTLKNRKNVTCIKESLMISAIN